MADVHITFADAGHRAQNQVIMDVLAGSFRSEVVTSSGSSATSTLSANDQQIARVFCATDIYVTLGNTASQATGAHVAGGIPEFFGLSDGQSVSVIDA